MLENIHKTSDYHLLYMYIVKRYKVFRFFFLLKLVWQKKTTQLFHVTEKPEYTGSSVLKIIP